LEREDRGVEHIAKLMGSVAEMLALPDGSLALHDTGVLGDRFGNRRVETTIQRVELLHRDRNVPLNCDFGNSLADVAVVVDDLRNSETGFKQFRAVLRSSGPDGIGRKGSRRRFQAQRLDELAQEQWYAVLEFARGKRRVDAPLEPLPRPLYDRVCVSRNELLQHDTASSLGREYVRGE
jgi:hypothetical protein